LDEQTNLFFGRYLGLWFLFSDGLDAGWVVLVLMLNSEINLGCWSISSVMSAWVFTAILAGFVGMVRP
jgi:hypothetical protein